LNERRAELHAKRRLAAVAGFAQWMESQSVQDCDEDPEESPRIRPQPRHRLVLAIAAVFGVLDGDVSSGGDLAKEQWELVQKLQSQNEIGAWIRLWNKVSELLADRLRDHRPDQYTGVVEAAANAWQEAEYIADVVQFDLASALNDAIAEFPEPASWSKEPGYTPDPMANNAAEKSLPDPKSARPRRKSSKQSV
jgi:hypothetical protein